MKIAVVSDIHGSLSALREFWARAEEAGADKVLLLGDLYYHGARNPLPEGYAPLAVSEFLNAHREKIIAVRGNCDSDVDCTVSAFDLAASAILCLGEKTIFASHGDRYDIEHLPVGKYDVVLYGHYHTGFIKEKEGIVVANPGSVSLPKGGTSPSYLLLDEGEIALHDLSGRLIDKRTL